MKFSILTKYQGVMQGVVMEVFSFATVIVWQVRFVTIDLIGNCS